MSELQTEPDSRPHDPVIRACGLTRRYGKSVAVDSIDFGIARGEVFGLLGPNGAGKTTTILMMLGLTEISSGEVSVLGFNPAREPLKVKQRVGYLPDAVGFYDQLTAVENLAYTAKLMGLARAERAARIEAALARVGLAEVAEKRVATYSRGMRQRLGLAEIIMKRAEIAILDEPTSGLDPQATQEFLGLIGELKAEGVTVLLSSHMLDQVQRVCDRVALFRNGRIGVGTEEFRIHDPVRPRASYGESIANHCPLRLAEQAQDLAQVVNQPGENEPARMAVAPDRLGGLQQVLDL